MPTLGCWRWPTRTSGSRAASSRLRARADRARLPIRRSDPRSVVLRRFSRFYTRRIGALEEGLARTPFSLTEARVRYELARREHATASELVEELALDPGYLSRILRRFQNRKLLDRAASQSDGRQFHLALTRRGRRAFADVDAASQQDIEQMLTTLPRHDRDRLVAAMQVVESLLARPTETGAPYLLREPRAGDMGWVVQSHGSLYQREYGWSLDFEALVAEIVASFIRSYDPHHDRCWLAERDGARVGSIFVVKHPERPGVARLRLLLVDPNARGLGIGKRLVEECSAFARSAGYHTITLWTNSVLTPARRLYEAEGYQLVDEKPHHSFGHDLVGQTWELAL